MISLVNSIKANFAFLQDVNVMALVVVFLAVILAIILIILIFAVRHKKMHYRLKLARGLLLKRDDEIKILKDDIDKLQKSEIARLKDLKNMDESKSRMQEKAELLSERLERSKKNEKDLKSKIEYINKEKNNLLILLERSKKEQLKLEESLVAADKRNEFWVDQISEIRIKYEALRNKMLRG